MKYAASPFSILPVSAASSSVVSSETLIRVNKAGKHVLAFVTAKLSTATQDEYVDLDKLHVLNFFAEFINPEYANTLNVTRGIANLVSNEILALSTIKDRYWVNRSLIRK
jgi:hypothetical protein